MSTINGISVEKLSREFENKWRNRKIISYIVMACGFIFWPCFIVGLIMRITWAGGHDLETPPTMKLTDQEEAFLIKKEIEAKENGTWNQDINNYYRACCDPKSKEDEIKRLEKLVFKK